MSDLDKALDALEARRAAELSERQRRRKIACDFLKSFFETDIKPSKKLKQNGIDAYYDGARLVLERPDEGHYGESLMIVIGEQGEIDVGGRSIGPYTAEKADERKNELIGEIIAHFSL